VKGWKTIYQANASPCKRTGIAILLSDKVDFKLKLVKRVKDCHFILMKGAIHQEEIIVNCYAPNASAPNFIKNTLKDLKLPVDPSSGSGKL
jgi:hypothetical protein